MRKVSPLEIEIFRNQMIGLHVLFDRLFYEIADEPRHAS